MALKKREKNLLISTAAAAALAILYFLWPSDGGSLGDLEANRDTLQKKLDILEAGLKSDLKNKKLVAEWNKRSLPIDPQKANMLYQAWLTGITDKAGLKNRIITSSYKSADVKATSSRVKTARSAAVKPFTEIIYTIKCDSSNGAMIRFLFSFYQSPHLHKIDGIDISPPEKDGQNMKVTIKVSALVMLNSSNKDALSKASINRLKSNLVNDYVSTFEKRNIFANAPEPKRPGPSQPPSRPIDALAFTFLTGTVEADDTPEAWLVNRTKGEWIKVHEGEPLKIGTLQGKVIKINTRDIEVEIDGAKKTLPVGESLAKIAK